MRLPSFHRDRQRARRALDVTRFDGIYAIVDRASGVPVVPLLEKLLAAGIELVQYRAKDGVERSVVRAMHERTRAAGATLVINDDFEAALEADGWHAGQEDLAGRDPRELRDRLGSRVFGVSAGLPEEARAAEAFGADYVGTGPFATTRTKLDAGPAIGIAGIRAVVAATRLPVVAIGGIDARNLDAVASSGAAMAALVSAFAESSDPAATAAALIGKWRAAVRT